MEDLLASMRTFFESGATRTVDFRKQQLRRFKEVILRHEKEIQEALFKDLHKSPEETWITETGFVLNEIGYALKKIDSWTKSQKVKTNLINFPSRSFIKHEPKGVVLIIAPWNYPIQLLLNPLVGAIAAGNCVVLKPSEFAPASALIMKKIIAESFDPRVVSFVEGDGAEIIPAMMQKFRFDHVFYTGSTVTGQKIYSLAAEKLVPVTLELGGKSPCVVEDDADLRKTARRIAMTKFSNCGQMCIAPDYVLVKEAVFEKFVVELKTAINEFFGKDAEQTYEYGRIINHKQFDRLAGYISGQDVIYGGTLKREALYIEPTLLHVTDLASAVMQEEIFGPLLPLIRIQSNEQALRIIRQHPGPLAFYVYTKSKAREDFWMTEVPAGNMCINNSSMHATNHHLPFGGRGNSGIGNYHGHNSFLNFSHAKGILKSPLWSDPKAKYPPFKGKLGLLKKLIG